MKEINLQMKTHKHEEIKSLALESHGETERRGLQISPALGSIQPLQKTFRGGKIALPWRGVQPLITAWRWMLIITSPRAPEQAGWRIAWPLLTLSSLGLRTSFTHPLYREQDTRFRNPLSIKLVHEKYSKENTGNGMASWWFVVSSLCWEHMQANKSLINSPVVGEIQEHSECAD